MQTPIRPSNAVASERAFIGAVINGDARAMDQGLCEADFTDAFCRSLYALCVRLEAQGKQPDLVTISDTDKSIDVDALLSVATEACVIGSLAAQYAASIRAAAQRRAFCGACLKAAEAAQDEHIPLEETIDKLRAFIDEQGSRADHDGTTSGTDALVNFALWLESSEEEPAISTGLPRIDRVLGGGLKNGRFYVIGARTSVGKSALMGFMATKAIVAGRRVLYVSCEMSEQENITRMIACLSGVSIAQIAAKKTLSPGQLEAVCDSYAMLGGENFRFSTTARTPQDIRRAALRMRAKMGLDMIVIDYIQILQPGIHASSRVEAVGEITRTLKLLALELNIPILSAAQINRSAVNGGGMPRLCDLRESGSIEQDADVVILLHRPDDQEHLDKKTLDIVIAKNRQGQLAHGKLIFDGAYMRYAELNNQQNAV